MLNFLNTAILAAAAAAVLPLLLHLFSRRKVKVVPFSSVAYLKAMRKHQVRAIKIKQILLLLVRTLIILAVVFAFARPATRGGYFGSHASVSAALVIDNTASMGLSGKDGRLFDLARKKADEILEQLQQDDEAAVLPVVGAAITAEMIFGNSASAAEVVDKVELTDIAADLNDAVNNAVRLLRERPNLNRELYIISDFQDNAIDPEKGFDDFDGTVYLVSLPDEESDNSGISGVDFGGQLLEVGTQFKVSATAVTYKGAADERLVSLYLDKERVAQEGIVTEAGETRTLDFDAVVNEPGYHSGYVMLSDDDLLADNKYYFSFYIPENFNILLCGDNEIDARLFRLALAPDENVRRHWSVKQIGYKDFSGVNLNDYDVVLLVDYSRLAFGDVERIGEYARRGGGVLVNLGQDADSAHFNDNLSGLTGVTLLSSFPQEIKRSGFYTMGDFDFAHQILSVFQDEAMKQPPEFKSFARIEAEVAPGGEVRVLGRYSDGSPAITVNKYERGWVMYFGCDVNPEISDISLHPFFVPFVVRSCEFLSSDFSGFDDAILAGESPRRPLRRSFNVKNEYMLVKPDGTRSIVRAAHRDNLLYAECGQLVQSGIYSIFNENAESDRFAVNVSPREGDLYRADSEIFETNFGRAEVLDEDTNLAGFITEKRFGRELWQYFLIAALLLLVAEMFLARSRGQEPVSDE